MPITDPTTGEISNAAFAFDTHNSLNDDPSIFGSAYNVVTKGLPLTGLSVVNSFYNTGVEVANVFGADASKLSVKDEVPDLESITGQSGLQDYYDKHEQGIEAAGLVVGSLVPGGLAVKGYKGAMAAIKVARAAETGEMTGVLSRATNLLPSLVKSRATDQAVSDIENSGSLFNSLTSSKIKAIAAGYGDQAIQGLVYEAATAATMKASPLLDKDSLKDTVENMFYGALVGGAVGGSLEAIWTRGVFNKARLTADTGAKSQEIFTDLGLGNYTAGDRVVESLDSIWNIPTATSALGANRALTTENAAALKAKKVLGTLTDDDPELTNSMFDVLTKMHDSGAATKEDAYSFFSRLAKVQRVTSAITPKTDDGTFYINRFAPASAEGRVPDYAQLMTNSPEEDAAFSLRYRLKEFSTAPRIATLADKGIAPDGSSYQLYTKAEDAWDAEHDMFIGKNNQIFVNPAAPNIEQIAKPGESRVLTQTEEKQYRETGKLPEGAKPLLGSVVDNSASKPAATILNVRTGAVTDKVVPTVGDYGAIKLTIGGLRYGEEFSQQSIKTPLTAETSTIDANARYVWANARGIRPGDAVLSTDIPMLEQLYKEGSQQSNFQDWARNLQAKQKVTFSGMEVPGSLNDIENALREAKDNLITGLQRDGKVGADEIAMRANVPLSYIENGLQASAPKAFMDPVENSSKLSHVQLWYDIGNLQQQEGMILKGLQDTAYRVQLVKAANQDVATNYFKERASDFISTARSSEADIRGAGGKFIASSNGAYGSFEQKMQFIGRNLSGLLTEKMKSVSTALAPAANALRNDEVAAAELGMFRAVRQRTSENFSFLPQPLAAKYFPKASPAEQGNIAVLTKSLVKDDKGNITEWNKDRIPEHFVDGFGPSSHELEDAGEEASGASGLKTFYQLHPKVADWERANQQLNDPRIGYKNAFYAANGLNRAPLQQGTLYTPPVNTANQKFFAYVRVRPGTGMADDTPHVVTAASQSELETKLSSLNNDYQVITKDQSKLFHQVEGDYNYQRNFTNTQIQSDLARRGILNEIYPVTRAQTQIEEALAWHGRQETGLARDHIELGNAQLFAELRNMGDAVSSTGTSKFGKVFGQDRNEVVNPYQSYIDTALNISQKDKYTTWNFANEKVEAFFDTAFSAARDSFLAAKKGVLPYEEASKIAEKFGLGNPYSAGVDVLRNYYDIANRLPQQGHLSKLVNVFNSVVGATTIRLDAFQSLIHVLSTPVLLAAEAHSAKQAVKDLVTMQLPDGTGRSIPATSKLYFNAVRNYFDDAVRGKWDATYSKLGADKTLIDAHRQMMNELTLPFGKISEAAIDAKITKVTDLGAKLTLGDWNQKFDHWITADVGRQLFEAAGFEGKDLEHQVMTFANRVQGNYIAGQRPIAFQGPLGQAMGLFQTYQTNLFQQAFRYVENKEAKSLAILAGLNTTFFGMNGLPGFQALNNHIVGTAAGNSGNADLYSATNSLLDKRFGDLALYGVTSSVLQTGLYARGDISPRTISLLPVNPMNWAAIRATTNFLGNLLDVSDKIAQGGSVRASLLLGLEHNGLSRPLSGLAQLIQGFSTNAGGKLISANDTSPGMSDLFSVANFSRLLGARPLDEAVTMDAMYRKSIYTAKSTARIEDLGKALKTKLYGGGQLAPGDMEEFAGKYASEGGNMPAFSGFVMRQTNEANASIANKVFRQLGTGRARNAMIEMGGVPLPDFTNTGSTEAASR